MSAPAGVEMLAVFSGVSPIRQFQRIWCGLLAISFAVDFTSHLKFYRWFSTSGLEMAKVRGYGQSAGKWFGIIRAPKLSVPAMALSGLALIFSLLLACTNLADPRLCLGSA